MAFEITKDRTSIIDIKDAREKARISLLQFTINPHGQAIDTVYGILKNKPKFTIDAQYDRLINMDEQFSFLNKIGGVVGVQIGLTKSWTRKVFKGGSYLEISLSARIIQDEITPNVVYTTKSLVSLCNPRRLFSDDETQKEVQKASDEENIRQKKKKDGETETKIANVGDLIKGFKTGAFNQSPPLCHLSISNYFRMDNFYVKGVAFEFSHEQTNSGPLYSDVEIELTQSEIVSSAEIKAAFESISAFTNK